VKLNGKIITNRLDIGISVVCMSRLPLQSMHAVAIGHVDNTQRHSVLCSIHTVDATKLSSFVSSGGINRLKLPTVGDNLQHVEQSKQFAAAWVR